MRYLLLTAVLLSMSSITTATDWLTLRSTYSHDPVNDQRVSQYAPIDAPTAPAVSNFRTSGYTNTRSSLNYGQSADNYHRVEKWGDPVRPYGEWRFPYRPYSTPYPNWGAPYAGLNLRGGGGYGGGGYGGGGYGGGGYGGGGYGGGGYGGGGHGGGGHGGGGGDHGGDHGGPGGGVGHGGGGNPASGDYGTRHWNLGGGGFGHRPIQRSPASRANSENPYPAGRGTPYPVAPYYDGYYPAYRQ